MENLENAIVEIKEKMPGLKLLENEPMSRHCSFRIGGPCDAMLLPSSVSEVETVCALLAEAGEKPLLIGNGTNLLVTDAPLHRIVLRLGEEFSRIEPVGDTALRAESGVTLSRLASFAAARSQRAEDLAHDAELMLRGYHVLRFTYAQIVGDWPAVQSAIMRALAQRLHLA